MTEPSGGGNGDSAPGATRTARGESTGHSAVDWSCAESELLRRLNSTPSGLSAVEAAARRRHAARPLGVRRTTAAELILRQFRNPIVIILLGVAVVSGVLGEGTQSAIVVTIVIASGALGFAQERGAMRAVHALLDTVSVHADVLRDGREVEVSVADVVPGDVVVLRAGDVVPGDARVIFANQLRLDEAALTGESYPRRKQPGIVPDAARLADRSNMVHHGTYVATGEGRVLVTSTGVDTEIGRIAGEIAERHLPTAFERGITHFGFMLMRATAVLVGGIFLVNVIMRRPVIDSVLFSLALAVGLTPQMLPAIVTLSMSRGAVSMARKKVIVKRLDAIEDVGCLDVLCTDKTGTITVGSVALHSCVDYLGREAAAVGEWAWLTSKFQRGFPNPLDDAILAGNHAAPESWSYVGEVAFDFMRKRMSVVVERGDETFLVAKGALEPLLECCTRVETPSGEISLDDARVDVITTFERLSRDGYRVLGVARRSIPREAAIDSGAERHLTLVGLLTFADPVKAGVDEAVRTLDSLGVRVRMITGDNRLAAAHVAGAIGLDPARYATGAQVEATPDAQLLRLVEDTHFYVEVDPIQKERIVRAYSKAGHTVGFLGDGINDAPALHAADVGVSVEGAVDVAKQTADLVLLNKDLLVLAAGIEQGRKIFANTLKYVHVTTSANFGNMLSLVAATLFLPYLPLLPLQILLLNFLSDIPGISIATDNVDPEQLRRPRAWNIANVRYFMIVFGLMSTVFDLATFAVLRLGINADAMTLRSGWFVESTLTELAALLMLRTTRPVWRSRPSTALLSSSVVVGMLTVVVPFTPIAGSLGFRAPSVAVVVALVGLTAGYVLVSELLKNRFSTLIEN